MYTLFGRYQLICGDSLRSLSPYLMATYAAMSTKIELLWQIKVNYSRDLEVVSVAFSNNALHGLFLQTETIFVWSKHKNMSPCTGSRVITSFERIASCAGNQSQTRASETQGNSTVRYYAECPN